MKAEILTIGDELLIGQVVNTNAAWLGEHLNEVGADVVRCVTLGDDVDRITAALAHAYEAADLVLITGGLGPTHDDVTREALAAFFETSLRFDAGVFAAIEARFAARGRRMPESNRRQAMVPDGFEVLPNPQGTAPGLWHVHHDGERERMVAVLPGVPHEMEHLVTHAVMPRLRRARGLEVIVHRTLLTTGIGESNLQERVGDVSAHLGPRLRLAYLPSTNGVRLRLTGYGADRAEVNRRLDAFERDLRARIDRYIYGTDDDTLEGAVGALLRARGLTVALAESCTGGLVAHRLTNVPGSSGYVVGGVVAYSNAVKVDLLGVDAGVLRRDGAVSEEVARAMARGVRARLGADIGIATTGIAGPGGGTADKPVGLVWIGYADAHGDHALKLQMGASRTLNKELFAAGVLGVLRRQLGRGRET